MSLFSPNHPSYVNLEHKTECLLESYHHLVRVFHEQMQKSKPNTGTDLIDEKEVKASLDVLKMVGKANQLLIQSQKGDDVRLKMANLSLSTRLMATYCHKVRGSGESQGSFMGEQLDSEAKEIL